MPRHSPRYAALSQQDDRNNTHKHPVPLNATNAPVSPPRLPRVGSKVDIWWEDRDTAFRGVLHARVSTRKLIFQVHYADGDKLTTDMDDVFWRFVEDGRGTRQQHQLQQQGRGRSRGNRGESGWYEPGDVSLMLDESRDRNFNIKDKKRIADVWESTEVNDVQSEDAQNDKEVNPHGAEGEEENADVKSGVKGGVGTEVPDTPKKTTTRNRRRKLRRLVRYEESESESCGTHHSASHKGSEPTNETPGPSEHDLEHLKVSRPGYRSALSPNDEDQNSQASPCETPKYPILMEMEMENKESEQCALLSGNEAAVASSSARRPVSTRSPKAKPNRAAHLTLALGADHKDQNDTQADVAKKPSNGCNLHSPTGLSAAVHAFDSKDVSGQNIAARKTRGENQVGTLNANGGPINGQRTGDDVDDGLEEWYQARKAMLPHRKRHSTAGCLQLLH